MCQIDLFEKYSYFIGMCAKKKQLVRNNYIKNINMNEQLT